MFIRVITFVTCDTEWKTGPGQMTTKLQKCQIHNYLSAKQKKNHQKDRPRYTFRLYNCICTVVLFQLFYSKLPCFTDIAISRFCCNVNYVQLTNI